MQTIFEGMDAFLIIGILCGFVGTICIIVAAAGFITAIKTGNCAETCSKRREE